MNLLGGCLVVQHYRIDPSFEWGHTHLSSKYCYLEKNLGRWSQPMGRFIQEEMIFGPAHLSPTGYIGREIPMYTEVPFWLWWWGLVHTPRKLGVVDLDCTISACRWWITFWNDPLCWKPLANNKTSTISPAASFLFVWSWCKDLFSAGIHYLQSGVVQSFLPPLILLPVGTVYQSIGEQPLLFLQYVTQAKGQHVMWSLG